MQDWLAAAIDASADQRRAVTDRAILAEHQPVQGAYVEPQCWSCGELDCCSVTWPCPTVRLLAVPYADAPGYLPEWAPEPAPSGPGGRVA
jgi:hypothetical protein